MAIRIKADDRVSDAVGDEDVYLPGPVKGDAEEGPFEFTYPRIGKLIRMQRQLKGLDIATAAAAEIDGMLEWLAAGFGPEAWVHIEGRMNKSDDSALLTTGDPEDADKYDLLDEEHMAKLFQLLNEGKTGRPTTSSNGASRQPWKNTSTAALSPLESVSAT